jgi:hypothetical protein
MKSLLAILLLGEVECFSSVGRASHLIKYKESRTRIKHPEIFDSHPFKVVKCKHRPSCLASNFYGADESEDDSIYDKDDGDGGDVEFEKYEVDASLMENIDNGSGASGSPPEEQQSVTDTQFQIEQQQKQIDMLMKMVQNQNQNQPQIQQQQQQQPQQIESQSQTQPQQQPDQPFGQPNSSNTDDMLPPPLPGMFEEQGEEELLDYQSDESNTSTSPSTMEAAPTSGAFNTQGGVAPVAPLKAMLFIDGTWLYYSLYRRKEEMDPIVKKFGKGWPFRYRFDWNALPRIICEQIVGQQKTLVSR